MNESKANTQQEIISDFWVNTSKKIFTTTNKYNLTTFVEGEPKHAAEVSFIKNMGVITPDATLLDLACGNGRLCEAFCQSVTWVTGTDLCENFTNYLNDWKISTSQKNVDFFPLDLLEPDYSSYFSRQYSVILLFGVTQCIIRNADLVNIFKNTASLLKPHGKLLVKQTTSIEENDLLIDHFSSELNHQWIAHYRTRSTIEQLAQEAGLSVVSAQPIYSIQNLGDHYHQVERWNNTRQIIFEMKKRS